MPRITVTDPADPRIAPYVSIQERDLTGRGDRFIVEGKVTLGALLSRGRFELESLFLCETRLAPLAGLLAQLPEPAPVYVAPQSVMDAAAGFNVHRGVLACARKGPGRAPADALVGADTALILAGLSNHDNVGAAFRNAAAFGAGAVLLDAASCDPLYRKAIRVSAGTALWLPFAYGGEAGALVETAQSAGFEVWAMTPRADATPLYGLDRPDKLAILLGPEGPGLAETLIDAARSVRIPMARGVDSLNVATAGAVALAWASSRRL